MQSSFGRIVENYFEQIITVYFLLKNTGKNFSVMHIHFLTTHPCVSDVVVACNYRIKSFTDAECPVYLGGGRGSRNARGVKGGWLTDYL